jgi:phage terminase large subunit-like protein
MTRQTNTSDRVTQYATDVIAEKIITGPSVRAACQRHLSDLDRDDIHYDTESANHAIGFFEEVLRLNGGEHEGMPFSLLGWQAFIVGSLFGWKAEDGYRRFRIAYVETGKGSGKTPVAAGVGLYMLTADGESRAEVYAAATKQDQARVLFRDAIAMVQQSPSLSGRLTMSGGAEKHNISYIKAGSFFRPISSERQGKGQSGPRPHCALLDEIHEHPTNAIVEFMRAGTKGRRQALIFMITNSGSDRESVCYNYHEYGKKIVNNDLNDDSFFSYICDLDKDDDPFKDEACWIKVNPSIGVTFQPKYLREQVLQAKGMPSKQNLVKRLNFCIWTDSRSEWIDQEAWESCQADLDYENLKGRVAYGGLDLSGSVDLTAMATVIQADDGTYDAFVEFWSPKDTLLVRENKDRVPYTTWAERGFLCAVPGKSIDYRYVVDRLGELSATYDYQSTAYDRWRINDLQREIDNAGVMLTLSEHGQGFKDMAPAIDILEKLIIGGNIRIQNNPILRWNASAADLDIDAAGGRKFTKKKSTGRIDGLVALVMAIHQAVSSEPKEQYITGKIIAL